MTYIRRPINRTVHFAKKTEPADVAVEPSPADKPVMRPIRRDSHIIDLDKRFRGRTRA